MREPIYILTDARGFVTASAASRAGMVEEAVRAKLVGPIEIASWTPVGDGLRAAGWRLLDKWVWKGILGED